jgi:hypothetical protein
MTAPYRPFYLLSLFFMRQGLAMYPPASLELTILLHLPPEGQNYKHMPLRFWGPFCTGTNSLYEGSTFMTEHLLRNPLPSTITLGVRISM